MAHKCYFITLINVTLARNESMIYSLQMIFSIFLILILLGYFTSHRCSSSFGLLQLLLFANPSHPVSGIIYIFLQFRCIDHQCDKLQYACLQDESRPKRRGRARAASNKDKPPSMTDVDPKDAFQMPFSDSDSNSE